jgi:hypothetical protein
MRDSIAVAKAAADPDRMLRAINEEEVRLVRIAGRTEGRHSAGNSRSIRKATADGGSAIERPAVGQPEVELIAGPPGRRAGRRPGFGTGPRGRAFVTALRGNQSLCNPVLSIHLAATIVLATVVTVIWGPRVFNRIASPTFKSSAILNLRAGPRALA